MEPSSSIAGFVQFVKRWPFLPVSGSLALVCTILLVAGSTDWAERNGIAEFISLNKGLIWLSGLFSGFAFLIGVSLVIIPYLEKNYYHPWRKARWQEERVKQREKEKLEAIRAHMEALTFDEKSWILLCLKKNTSTLIARHNNVAAHSLLSRGFFISPRFRIGSATTPFTIKPEIWAMLLESRDQIVGRVKLSEEELDKLLTSFEAWLEQDDG